MTRQCHAGRCLAAPRRPCFLRRAVPIRHYEAARPSTSAYPNGNEPDTSIRRMSSGGTEMRIITALFDSLTTFIP